MLTTCVKKIIFLVIGIATKILYTNVTNLLLQQSILYSFFMFINNSVENSIFNFNLFAKNSL